MNEVADQAVKSDTPQVDQLCWEPLFVMDLVVGYDRAQPIGATPVGGRFVFPVDGGTFEGSKLRGTVNPGGVDWVTRRDDGAMLIDVRLTLLTDDGATIGMTYTGIARARDEATMAKFLRRELLPYGDMYFHTAVRFEAGEPRYAWLNGIIAVTNGVRREGGGRYHVFAIV